MSPPPAAPARVCVFARFWEPGLGDFMQRNIFLALLRRAWPEAEVTQVVGPALAERFSEFLARHSYATGVLTCPDYRDDDPAAWRRFRQTVRERRFDVCVVDPDTRGLGARVAADCGIPVRIGFPVVNADPSEDAYLTAPIRLRRPIFGLPDLYDYAAGLAGMIGLGSVKPADVAPPFLYQPEPVNLPPSPVVAVHPGGARHWNRRWPFASYVELCRRLIAEDGASVLLLGSGDEAAELAELRNRLPRAATGGRAQISAGESINRLANLLSHAAVLVGSDSAPAHLAAALRRPTVVLYGPTMTEFMWARIYPRHHGINRHYDCQTVRNLPRGAGNVTMPCRHSCHYPYVSAAGPYPRCLSDIGVDEVVEATRRQMANVRPARPVASPRS